MIDFTNTIEELNNYKGSEKKKTLIYNGKRYLVKFPDPIREKNKNISYINNAFSEYIGSNIFKICGFEVQNTILGKYIYIEKKENQECNNALKRLFCKIDIAQINEFIENIECISTTRKEFYKNIIHIRYNILKKVI